MWRIATNKNWSSLEQEFDWVTDMSGIPQDPIFHAEGDVAIHTQMVLAELLDMDDYQSLEEQQRELLFAAALLHDVEKRSTTEFLENGRISSPRHAKKGSYTSRDILYREIITPFKIREEIVKLVRYHGLPIWLFEKKDPLKALVQCSLEVNTSLLYLLAKADVLGRESLDQDDFLERVELFKEYCIEQDCWGKSRSFENDLARFNYFNKENAPLNYVPFDNTKGTVIMMCGLPGSGKDTFIQKHYSDLAMVSLDEIRRENKISPKDGKAQGKVAQIAKEKMRVFLRRGESFVFNATNITRDLRMKNINLFSDYKFKVKIIYLEKDYKELLKQNRNREEVVPLNVIHRLIKKIDIPTLTEVHEVEYVLSD